MTLEWRRFVMFALIEASGKQYPVQEGSVNQVVVGRPYVEGAKVKGIVLRNGKSKKVVVFKYKPKVKYRRLTGHRQPMTLIKIQSIES